ncbi:acyltransferase [Paenibacillus sp. GSMTC-2017]|uniref:acyltransferase n=1 Tax=Paenibacillus sp. GSMTC-2017 TaxID=2794350 RepID=UPI0018D8BAA1|nr:acyltransferase [Paenibacillus sp. GSMTC-2017]MBH5318891.1 acyltransferase [Paenibacillus sp. GSMTC-2017]
MSKHPTIVSKDSRITEIELVRAIAIIGVLAVHATSFATVEMLSHPSSYFIYNFINIFMKFGTAVFIFLSSFVLFHNYFHKPLSKKTLTSFYRKRLIYIVIPFAVFSTIYYVAVAVTREKGELPANLFTDFIIKLTTGTAYTHLYFIFISIQFYLLFPIVLLLFKKVPTLIHWCIPLGFVIQWGFYGLNQLLNIPYDGSWAFSYFSIYMLGVYVGIRFNTIKKSVATMIKNRKRMILSALSIAIWGFWLFIGIWHTIIWYELRVNNIAEPLYLYTLLWNVYVIASALVFMQTAFYVQRKWSNNFVFRKFRELGNLTFGIYLFHPLLLAAYREFRPETSNTTILHFWYVIGFFLALIGSWYIVSAVHRYLPFSWMVFGKDETKKSDNPHISV